MRDYDGSKPSLYVGETARSLHERAKEHLSDFGAKKKGSHIWRHQLEHHGGSQEHAFLFRIVETPRNALSRQIGEAVKISRRGGEGAILNAKGEYNRCHITRLTLGEEEDPPGRKQDEGGEGEESTSWILSQGANWESRKTKEREQIDKQKSRILCKEPKSGGEGRCKLGE